MSDTHLFFTVLRILAFVIGLFSFGNIVAQCNADFSIVGLTCDKQTIQFKANDSTKTLKYSWNFGDKFSGLQNTDTVRNPKHVFSQSGKYKITLIVNDTNGCKDTIIKTFQIFANPKPLFSYNNACAGLTTSFTDLSVADTGDAVTKWSWRFGNSKSSGTKNPVNAYNATGTYKVVLSIVSAAGCKDSIFKNITVFKKPTAQTDLKAACKNGQINFIADTIKGAIAYRWDFGDSSFFSVRTASHVYKKTGILYPILTVDFGTTQCKIAVDSLFIRPLPIADFTVNSDTHCYNQNNVCVKLKTKGQKIKLRTVIFDDGTFDDATPLSDSLVCHSYTDIKGGKYTITLELIDSNNCLASFTAVKPVTILPQVKASFNYTGGIGCFNTGIVLTNTSSLSPPAIKKFRWDFGDGSKDSSNWSGFKYVYHKDGKFNISLRIEDKAGCSDTVFDNGFISNTAYTVDAHVDSIYASCRSNNVFGFKQTPITGAKIAWFFWGNDSSNSYTPTYHFRDAGIYSIFVRIRKNGCDSLLRIDSIRVSGPQANIGNIQNRVQCQIKDTVYMENVSVLFLNKSAMVRWDAGDVFGPQCTLNTKQSINLGMNCNFSVDSFKFKHKYQKGKENCYYVKLVVTDTIIGCSDSTYAAFPLMAPLAKGLFTPTILNPCPGPELYKTLSFDVNQSQPNCFKYAWWVMWDSLAAVKSGNFNANWQLNSYLHNYLYGQQNGDSAGNVSIGLIVENGLDTNGVTCRDTGWFHHVVNVSRMTPLFNSNYDPAQYYCPGTTFRFYSADSNQVAGTTFLWNFGDGTVVTTNNLKSIAHTFKKAGKYRVHLTVTDPNGCRGDTALYLKVGVYKNFTVTPTIRCVGDTFKIVQLNRYYDTIGFANNFWGDTLRAKAGKEQIKFDLGNGLGYQNLGPNPKFSYAYPGLYPISMLVSDSLGCWDTLSKWYTLSVSGVYAEFVLPKDSFLCAQTIDLTSTATTVDSTVNKGLPGDAIVKYQWDFGAKYAPSFVQNPRRFFSIGNFNIKLKVTNKYGCIDSITHPLVLIGPQAAFDFVGDTIGCEPLLITFKNKSKFATDYIWQFNDATKNAFATKSDTNISFVYRGNGNFYPTLTARGLFTKNGLSQVCDDIYPDTSTQLKRTVTLWELPKPDFKWVTDCKNSTTTFANTSFISTGSITSIQWNFGDGSTSNSAAPTHSYADTGSYQVVLKATSDHGCVDSVVKTVVISPVPTADFSFTKTCLGALTNFSDLSLAYNDRIYQWNWEFGNGNTSGLKNPAIKYLTDTTFNVKLKVMNVAGCADSIVKQITIYSHAKPDFTFTNVCDKSRMFFGNFTTSKQVVTGVEWQFGDGDTSMHWSTDHLYNSIGNYNVQLKAVTEFGCIDSISKTVTIYPNPKAGIAINSKGQCFRNNDFLFTDTTTIASGSTTSNWVTGDAGTSTSKSFNHTYKNTGRYYIQLISVSNFNCADTLSDSVDVYEMPVAKFGIDKKVQCFNYNLFNFSDSSKIAVGSYTVKWLLGNGDTGTGTKFQYHYKDSGVYNTAVSVTSNFGCADTAYTQVNLLSMPGAFFTINDSIQCFKRHQFLYTGRNKSASYTWDFGDNYVNNGANPVPYSYQKTGTYKVLLKQTNSNNCTDTFTSTVVILHSPDALFKITDSLQCLYQNNFAFTNKSTIGKGTLTYTWRFGDGDSALTTNASHVYKVASTYTVSLIALSDLGCPDTLTQPVVVHPMPLVIPKVNAAFACINGQNIQFGDSSTIQTGSISPTWKFGDNTVSSLKNPSKKYASAQAFTVWLIETSDFGCVDSASIKLLLNPKPNPSFSINDTGQCLNANNFVFTNKSVIQSGTITSKWNFGNGASQTAQNAFQNYLNYGTYRVTLLVTSDSGCVDSSYVDVVVHPMPIAGFSVNAREQCLKGNQFQFTNNSSIASGSLNYKWRFGDTAKSTQSAPSHTYGSFGTFMVWLKATSGFGCTDSINDFMLVDPMPQVRFVTNDSTQCFNIQNFVFTDSSKIASGSLSRNWSLSDGFTATTRTVNRVFADDTTYTVKLVQISDRGCSDSISKIMEVYSNPKSNFVINDTDQCLKQNNFVFTNTSTLAKGNLTHLWKFGDLQTSTITGPAHRYFAYGNFTVTLISTTDNGCVDSTQKIIRVDAMPVVSFTINDTGQCINNQNFIFTNKSSIAVGTLQYLWKFGDATTSNLINPTKQFPVDTLYRVLLTATSNKGCKDSSSKIIDVHPRPYSNFTINDSIQCLRGNNFIFTNKAKIQFKVRAGTLSYNWRLGDGNTSTSTNINHTYTNNGNFNVWLRATSDLGCVDSAFKVVTIGAMPNPSFTVNDPGQCFKINNFGFTNKSSIASGTQSYFWKFGDTDTLRATNASHVYKAIGTFNPRLIATSNYGCIDSVSVAIIVNPNAKASFTVNDSDQCINNQNFIFNNTSTVSSGQVVKWLYSFGNGQFGNQAQSKGVYRNSGFYTIILQTTTDSGCVDSFSKTIRVYPKPKAAFAINDSMQCLRGNYFVFRNRSMDSIGLQSFLWNINDESLQILDSAVYSFKSDSVKNITLIVNSIVGCADTITRQVTVKPMPDPSFQPLNLFYCINSGTYPLSPKTPGGTFLGKNVVSNQYVPTNLWEDTVIYRVTVNGCTDSSSRFTNVYPGPNAFLGNDTVLCKYEALELRVNSWSSKYVWNTGSDRQYIKVTDPGTYSVIVTNACGIDYDTIIVQFRTVNCRLFLANAFTPNGDGINDFYKPVTNNVAEMEYEIFNRWGEKIFIGTLNDAGWDGTCRGEPVQEDAYLVVVTYTYSSADHFFKLSERGTVILMR